jgi:negative regulator of sigma E activity
MSAPEFDELLSAYLDNEVTTEERAIVEQRLERSPAVREKLDELSEVSEVVKSLPRSAAPTGLVARVMEQVRTPEAPQPRAAAADPPKSDFISHLRHRRRRMMALVAAACVVVAVVMMRKPAGRNADNGMLVNADRDLTTTGAAPKASPTSSPEIAAAPMVRESASGTRMSATAIDSLSEVESLKELVKSRNGSIERGEFLNTMDVNAGNIEVRRYIVTDIREFSGTTQALFARNGIDSVEIEYSSPPAGKSDGAARYDAGVQVFFIEAEGEQLEQALEELDNSPAVTEVSDYGTLKEISEVKESGDGVAERSVTQSQRAESDFKLSDPSSQTQPPLAAEGSEEQPGVVGKAGAKGDEAQAAREKDEAPRDNLPSQPPPAKAVETPPPAPALVENAKPADAVEAKQSYTNGLQVAVPPEDAEAVLLNVQNRAPRESYNQKSANRARYSNNRAIQQQQRAGAGDSQPGRILIILQGGPQPAGALAAPAKAP